MTDASHVLLPTPRVRDAKPDRRDGYARVSLATASGRYRTHKVHRLVLEAFVGPCPDGMECLHSPDATRTNNRLDNLRWGTHQDNVDEVERAASDDVVRAVFLATGPLVRIATEHGVSLCFVQRVRSGVSRAYATKGMVAPPRADHRLAEHKTRGRGSDNGTAKLNEEKVRDVRRRLAAKESCASIGRLYGVTTRAIWAIKAGQKWKHVTL
jgi:hypothetical protein